MPLYQAYGLTLSSSFPFSELLPGKGEADVFVEIREAQGAGSAKTSPICCASASRRRVHLTWGAGSDLLIEDGRSITAIPIAEANEAALRLFILGAGLGVLLHQRGLLVFHASGVAVRDGAAGFFGSKGWGKSTMAAALHQLGNPLISDELLAVRFDRHGQPWVLPGTPQLRLWSDALASAGVNPEAAIRVRPGIEKFSLRAASSTSTPHVFRCAYLLDAGPEPSIRCVPLRQAFLGLVPHLYVSRFGSDFLAATDAPQTFQQLNAFVTRTPVKCLTRRRNLSEIPEVARLVEQDVAGAPVPVS